INAEYFIDTDPGMGNGQPISIGSAVNITDAIATINTTGLSNGVHRLYIRARSNEGRWSLTNLSDFIVDSDPPYPAAPATAQNIINAEYFIDTDPGMGNGQPVSLSPGVDLNGVVAAINTSGLSNGVHRLYLRTKSTEGKWSMTNNQDFSVDADPAYPAAPAPPQNIVAAEYFLDTDPGTGSGTPIAITPNVEITNIMATINTTGLSNGSHIVFIRTKSQEGKWSLSNHATFFTDNLAVSPDTIAFGAVPEGITAEKNLIVKNNSATAQTITAISIGTGFITDAILPVNITAGTSDTIKVSFTPTGTTTYLDSAVLTTSSGKYKTVLTGNGVAQTFNWMISPANGYNYGNVTINATANYSFTIYNKSNIPVTLSSVISDNAAFVPGFTPGTVIAPNNGSLSLPVAFTPTAAGSYAAQIKIISSTPGISDATVNASGNGYSPGTPPTLEYVPGGVYNGTTGVNPAAGPAGVFTYKILYKSTNNKAPLAGYPKVSIDLNGNHTFNDLNEGVFTMVKEGSSTDYINGVVYTYTFNIGSNTNNAGYQFETKDEDGNSATAGTAYKSGPVVTDETLDLRIFANDISFSNSNPQPGATFTMTARVSNSSAVPASNVPMKFYRDTILIGSAILPSVPANGSNTINYTLNFADEGFYPIKVWIDSSNTLGDNNILNNYAIRPVIVGSPNLPGGINVTTSALRQECPQLQVKISGHADYYGTGTNTPVAGAEVTINTGSQTYKTTTNANGDYSIWITGVTCGSGNFAYAVTVTDFTFTSNPASNSIPVPCPAPNACQPPVPQPSMGGITAITGSSPCDNIAGGTGSIDFKIKIRERNINNMWSGFDEITGGYLKVYVDGLLINDWQFSYGGLVPGDELTIVQPWQIPQSTDPVTISGELVYTYVEYEQIPNTATIRPHYITYNIPFSKVVTPETNLPDLSIQNFAQTSYTSFRFDAVNLKCVTAGSHKVKIFDGATLIKTETISSLAGGASRNITYSDPSLTPGVHQIRVFIDADEEITESDETNNDMTFTITVIAPDLTVTNVNASPTLMNNGTSTQFTAVIKNTGKATGSFNVSFAVNGVQVGAKKTVAGISENGTITVTSDAYTVSSNTNTCGDMLEVFADSDVNIAESDESNNIKTIPLSADLKPYQLSYETGSAANPAIVRVNNSGDFFPAIRNNGIRDAANVTVHYLLNGVEIGTETIPVIKAGEQFAAHGAFSHMFSAPGDYAIRVVADSLNSVCESDETNNVGFYRIRVTDSKPDLEVLSQYISPSSLNPLPAQNITIVGTVRNAGGKVTTGSVMRFFVDDIQLGDDVPFNAIQPGKDTTVQATITYSSLTQGTKIMKIVVDPLNTMVEERENNNEATRALLVGEAPDLAKRFVNSIRFNPNGFKAGDSVTVSYDIINNGTVDGAAWVRFMILDINGGLQAIDSIPFSLAAGGTTTVSRKMFFNLIKGKVVAQIVNCTPVEYNELNNSDTLSFSTIKPLTRHTIINGNLDMKQGIPDDVPGWIGGKLLLGDFDLTVNGSILNADSISHFIVTNGTGKLKLANNNTENVFPVATDTSHGNFLKIGNTGTPDNFSVRVAPFVLQSGNSGDTVRTGNVNRTWFIDEQTPGGSNATITFNWKDDDEQPSFDRLQSSVAHFVAGWQVSPIQAAVVGQPEWYSKSQSGYTGFSPFVINSINSALPLTLLKFEVKAERSNAQIKWTTTAEVNTAHFEVEHSIDGNRFETIGTVMTANSAGTHQYAYTHLSLSGGTHYYRLKMVDRDGRYRYSSIQRITINTALQIGAYPNPASQQITISGLQPEGTVQLMTISGSLLGQWKPGSNTLKISLSGYTNGIYIVRYHYKGTIQQIKVIKE
ncbi:MAG TPA: CARDB domain-containing protein, partial [Agriterribacter sp.]|nr:CARDB domain-containing protein [Agriterribacter sp.]